VLQTVIGFRPVRQLERFAAVTLSSPETPSVIMVPGYFRSNAAKPDDQSWRLHRTNPLREDTRPD